MRASDESLADDRFGMGSPRRRGERVEHRAVLLRFFWAALVVQLLMLAILFARALR